MDIFGYIFDISWIYSDILWIYFVICQILNMDMAKILWKKKYVKGLHFGVDI